jgi:hypothetical protein
LTNEVETTNEATKTGAEELTTEQLAQLAGGTSRNGNLQITQFYFGDVTGRVTSIAVDP